MDAVIMEFRVQDRKPGTYLALGVGMAASYVVYLMHLPPWVWALAAAYLTLVLIRLSINRGTAFRLRSHAIDCTINRAQTTIPLASVASFARDARETSVCLLKTYDGDTLRIPCGDAGRAAQVETLIAARLGARQQARSRGQDD